MSLKTAAIACAIAASIHVIISIGSSLHSLATVEFYTLQHMLNGVPYWAFVICCAIFFYLFSKRM